MRPTTTDLIAKTSMTVVTKRVLAAALAGVSAISTPALGVDLIVDGQAHTVGSSGGDAWTGTSSDFRIHPCTTGGTITLTCKAGDGGDAFAGGNCNAWGGKGAELGATFQIGTGVGQLAPGGELRFVIGKAGRTADVDGDGEGDVSQEGGGGGGSGILYRAPGDTGDTDWHILMVAGGGSGAHAAKFVICTDKRDGMNAETVLDGHGCGAGGGGNDAGAGGCDGAGGGTTEAGSLCIKATGGAGAFGQPQPPLNMECHLSCDADPQAGYPAGGDGYVGHTGFCDAVKGYGGYGFGGGGGARDSGGGGGGYSGGGGGNHDHPGGGGGSWITADFAATDPSATASGSENENGWANYMILGGDVLDIDRDDVCDVDDPCDYDAANECLGPVDVEYPDAASVWNFDEGLGATAIDTYGSHNGAINGATYVAGQNNTALSFNGSSDHLLHDLMIFPQGTLVHWLRPDQVRRMVAYYESNGTGSGVYNGFGDPISGREIHSSVEANGTFHFMYQDGTESDSKVVVAGGAAVPGQWAHVAVTWDTAGDLVLYVNATEEDRVAMSGTAFGGHDATYSSIGRVGDGQPDRHWHGLIDEVAVFGRALTATEIMNVFSLGLGDGVITSTDNCPYTWNPDQADFNDDGVGDACDACADGSVGLGEYANFAGCLLGPGGALGVGCECFDFDIDGDNDLRDFAEFQVNFTGN